MRHTLVGQRAVVFNFYAIALGLQSYGREGRSEQLFMTADRRWRFNRICIHFSFQLKLSLTNKLWRFLFFIFVSAIKMETILKGIKCSLNVSLYLCYNQSWVKEKIHYWIYKCFKNIVQFEENCAICFVIFLLKYFTVKLRYFKRTIL